MRGSITRITYQNGIQGADRVEDTLSNERLQWIDDPLLQVDNGFSLSLGYAPDPLHPVFVGEITGVNMSFPSGGVPTVVVVAHDFLQRLTRGTKDRAFALSIPCIGKCPLPDPAVAALVAVPDLLIPRDPVGGALSFLTLLVATPSIRSRRSAIRIQQGQSDFDFLTQVARENGWGNRIDHSLAPRGYVLRFQFLIQDYSASTTLKWESRSSISPRSSRLSGRCSACRRASGCRASRWNSVIVLSWDYDRAAFDLMVYPGAGNLDALMGKKSQAS
jgi:hypothetical protein